MKWSASLSLKIKKGKVYLNPEALGPSVNKTKFKQQQITKPAEGTGISNWQSGSGGHGGGGMAINTQPGKESSRQESRCLLHSMWKQLVRALPLPSTRCWIFTSISRWLSLRRTTSISTASTSPSAQSTGGCRKKDCGRASEGRQGAGRRAGG